MAGIDDTGFGSGTATSTLVAPDALGDVIAQVRKELESVVDEPVWPLTDDQVQVRLREVLATQASLSELAARLLRSVTDRELPRRAGSSSARAWLISQHGVSVGEAGRLLAQATAHPGDPDGITRHGRCEPTRAAWAEGVLSAERAVVLSRAIDKLDPALPASVTDPVQIDLIGRSAEFVYEDFQRLCARTVEIVDPETADKLLERQLQDQEARAEELTTLSFRRVGDGTTRFNGRLSDLAADMWKAALDAYSNPHRQHRRHDPDQPVLPDPDSELRAVQHETAADPPIEQDATPTDPPIEQGATPTDPPSDEQPPPPPPQDTSAEPLDDGRPKLTYRQRLGRALSELLEHLPVDKFPQHGASSPTVVVNMTLEQLHGESGEATVDTGTVISASQARRLACNAGLIPAVLDGRSKILDLGLARRLYDRYQRIALALRDGGCVFPGCDRTARWCEAHHIVAWSEGGPTDIANGCLLCCFHHHLIHQGEWAVVMAADGKPEIIPPPRIDPTRTSRRHERLKPQRC